MHLFDQPDKYCMNLHLYQRFALSAEGSCTDNTHMHKQRAM
jgi:hypothetical protein